ncbi:large ribosomal subunit protein mL66-like [Lytechinus pictus]|uniref:large ribosomal subunit protein mL66-like n=1 Tax=Lytechinus pictus TaxID=7653 RepID=UPI00240D3AC3|nr:28S ribosomal protein S18a, mitochondrial-like [Lytechinus pictus]
MFSAAVRTSALLLTRNVTKLHRFCSLERRRGVDHCLKAYCASSTHEKFRKVTEETVGDTIKIEASYEEAGNSYSPIDNPHGACPICSRNLHITYKDVLILSQFVDNEGNVLPRDITGVCAKQQLHLRECVERALAADLLPDHRPSHLPSPKEKEPGKAVHHRF